MNINRVKNILSNNDKIDVFYKDRLVWIQGVSTDNKYAKVGFIDNFDEQDVLIDDLYE